MRLALAAVTLALCACNALFDLRDTHLIEAVYDAPADAAPICPQIGTPPQFTTDFRQGVLESCDDYTVSATAGRALAKTRATNLIIEGAIDSSLDLAAGFQSTQFSYDNPRLGPDGDVAVASVYDNVARATKFSTFRRTDAGWVAMSDITPGFTIAFATAPTRGAPARMIVVAPPGMHELEDDAGSWTDVASYTFTDLGVTTISEPNLTPDGLRLVFGGTIAGNPEATLLYADRPDITQRFSAAVPLPLVDFLPDGFMTENCGRLYFTALDTVFFAERI